MPCLLKLHRAAVHWGHATWATCVVSTATVRLTKQEVELTWPLVRPHIWYSAEGLGDLCSNILLCGPQQDIWPTLLSASCQPDSISGLDLCVKAKTLSWREDPHILKVRGQKKFPCCCQKHSNLQYLMSSKVSMHGNEIQTRWYLLF